MRFTYSQRPNQEIHGSSVYGGQYRKFSSSNDSRRKETEFPKLTNFEVCHHLHVYPTQTTHAEAVTFLGETVLKQIFVYQYQTPL